MLKEEYAQLVLEYVDEVIRLQADSGHTFEEAIRHTLPQYEGVIEPLLRLPSLGLHDWLAHEVTHPKAFNILLLTAICRYGCTSEAVTALYRAQLFCQCEACQADREGSDTLS